MKKRKKRKERKVSRWGRRAEGEQEGRKWVPEPISGNRLSREKTKKAAAAAAAAERYQPQIPL